MLTAFPLFGLVLLAIFTATAVACVAAAVFMETEGTKAKLANASRWPLYALATAAVLLLGTMTVGFYAVPLCMAAIAGVFVSFAKAHDQAVPEPQRILTPAGRQRLIGQILKKGGKPRPVQLGPDGKPIKPPSLVERLKQFGKKREPVATAAKGATDKAGAAKPAEKAGGMFGLGKKPAVAKELVPISLLKKNGDPAFGDQAAADFADNVVAAQKMLLASIKVEATDIHMEPRGDDQYHIRFRVDGVLQNHATLSVDGGKGVISALKVVSDMDIAERRRPQDGGFAAIYEGSRYDMRAASTPTSSGEKMVIRVLKSSGGMTNSGLTAVGLRTPILTQLREVIHKPYGMFLVTGPTGSGKTTTVYASLNEIDAAQHNITTIEDPVEYRLDGITQISVNTQAGVTFASILRSVLRQDPDVLLVGEIRDKETAEIACQAALTGHFVFSTLHANDTVATVTRMLDLGLDPMLIQTAVTAVLAQRLARRLCPACKEPYEPPADLLARLAIKPGVVKTIYREKGCEACGGSGYKGRTGLHELLVMNDEIRGLITAQPSIQDLRAAARRNQTRSLQTDGLLKVMKGLTSVNEVVRVTT
jgi:type II secretory ATPase GspE/PulE/Tfp pilus assembly ATPase PilB-like protein